MDVLQVVLDSGVSIAPSHRLLLIMNDVLCTITRDGIPLREIVIDILMDLIYNGELSIWNGYSIIN